MLQPLEQAALHENLICSIQELPAGVCGVTGLARAPVGALGRTRAPGSILPGCSTGETMRRVYGSEHQGMFSGLALRMTFLSQCTVCTSHRKEAHEGHLQVQDRGSRIMRTPHEDLRGGMEGGITPEQGFPEAPKGYHLRHAVTAAQTDQVITCAPIYH